MSELENQQLLQKLDLIEDTGVSFSETEQVTNKPKVDKVQRQGILRIGVALGLLLAVGLPITLLTKSILNITPVANTEEEPTNEISLSTTDDKDKLIADLRGQLATESQNQDIATLQNRITLELDNKRLQKNQLPKTPITKIPAPPKPQPSAKVVPIARPAAPRPIIPSRTPKETKAKTNPEEIYASLSNFGIGFQANSTTNRETTATQVAVNPTENLSRRSTEAAPEALQVSFSQTLTPGAQGILNQSPAPVDSEIRRRNTPPRNIQLGTEAKAEIVLPLVWNQGSSQQQYGNFALSLKENIEDNEGNIVFPKNATVVAETQQVSSDGVVEAHVIGISYEEDGQQIEENIEPGSIIVRSSKKEAVIAKRANQEDRRNFLTLGTLASLANVGEAIARPNNSTSITNTNGSSITSTVTDDQGLGNRVLGGVLEGFFDNLQQQIVEEQQQQSVTRRNTPVDNIFILEKGYKTELIVIKPLKIN